MGDDSKSKAQIFDLLIIIFFFFLNCTKWMVKTKRSRTIYQLIYRVIVFVLTFLMFLLPTVPSAIMKWKVQSRILIDKIELCNIKKDFLKESLILYIERKIARKFNTESIIYDF